MSESTGTQKVPDPIWGTNNCTYSVQADCEVFLETADGIILPQDNKIVAIHIFSPFRFEKNIELQDTSLKYKCKMTPVPKKEQTSSNFPKTLHSRLFNAAIDAIENDLIVRESNSNKSPTTWKDAIILVEVGALSYECELEFITDEKA